MGGKWIRGNGRLEQLLADPDRRAQVEELVVQMRAEDEAPSRSSGRYAAGRFRLRSPP